MTGGEVVPVEPRTGFVAGAWLLPILALAGWRFCEFVYLFVHWLPWIGPCPAWMAPLPALVGLALGAFLWWLWRIQPRGFVARAKTGGLLLAIAIGGVIGGFLGFDAMLAWGEVANSNLGPPVAFFVAGPVGSILGVMVGAAVHITKVRSHSRPAVPAEPQGPPGTG